MSHHRARQAALIFLSGETCSGFHRRDAFLPTVSYHVPLPTNALSATVLFWWRFPCLQVWLLGKTAVLISCLQVLFPEWIPLDLYDFPSAFFVLGRTSLHHAFRSKLRVSVIFQFSNLSTCACALYTENNGCKVSLQSPAPSSPRTIDSMKLTDKMKKKRSLFFFCVWREYQDIKKTNWACSFWFSIFLKLVKRTTDKEKGEVCHRVRVSSFPLVLCSLRWVYQDISGQLQRILCAYLPLYEDLLRYQACRLFVVFHVVLVPEFQLRSAES